MGPGRKNSGLYTRKVGVHGHFYEVSENIHHSHNGQRSKERERKWRRSPNNSLNHGVTDKASLGYLPLEEILSSGRVRRLFGSFSYHLQIHTLTEKSETAVDRKVMAHLYMGTNRLALN